MFAFFPNENTVIQNLSFEIFKYTHEDHVLELLRFFVSTSGVLKTSEFE